MTAQVSSTQRQARAAELCRASSTPPAMASQSPRYHSAGAFACPQGCPLPRPDPFGRFSTSSLTIDGALSPVDYFLIDQDHGFFIETDAPDSFQVSLGYFAERCDVTLAGNCQQAAQKGLAQRFKGPHMNVSGGPL